MGLRSRLLGALSAGFNVGFVHCFRLGITLKDSSHVPFVFSEMHLIVV